MRPQRLASILDLVRRTGHISIAEVCAALGVSPATARRDLDSLAAQKLVQRTYGGASALVNGGHERTPADRTAPPAEAETGLARRLTGLVPAGATVGLNGGTTTTEVARELARADHLTPSDGSVGFTLVTNALNIAYELTNRPHVHVAVSGGSVRARSFELTGPVAVAGLRELVLDVAVLGVDGVHPQFGTTTADAGQAEVGRSLAAAAHRVVVVADRSKHGVTGPHRLLPLEDVDVLVTDAVPDRALGAALTEAGVEVVTA